MKNKNIFKILFIFMMLYNSELFVFNVFANDTLYPKRNNFSAVGSFFQIIFLLFVFVVILILTYYTTKLFANSKIKSMKKTNMSIIETISIGFNHIHILKVSERYFLISSSKDGIKLLSELDENVKIITNSDNNTGLPFEESLKNCFDKLKSKGKSGGKYEK